MAMHSFTLRLACFYSLCVCVVRASGSAKVYAVVQLRPDEGPDEGPAGGAVRSDAPPLVPPATPQARSVDAHVTEPCRIDHGQ